MTVRQKAVVSNREEHSRKDTYNSDSAGRSSPVIVGSLQVDGKIAPDAPAKCSEAEALLVYGLGSV